MTRVKGKCEVCGFPLTRAKNVKEFIKDIMRHKARCPKPNRR